MVFLLGIFQSQFYLSDNAFAWLLRFLSVLLSYMGKFSNKLADISKKFPQSIYTHNQATADLSKVSGNFETRVACRSCFTLYLYEDCYTQHGSIKSINACSYKPFHSVRVCGEKLMREVVSSSGRVRFYPHKYFCYSSIASSIQGLILHTNFLELCESTRQLSLSGNYSDVYDSKVWKEFQVVDGLLFLSSPNCYGLLLNVDCSNLSNILYIL